MKKEEITTNDLAHTKGNSKYHIVFASKYGRKVFYEDKRLEIQEILQKLCEWKRVGIVEGEVSPDHKHILVRIPPKMKYHPLCGWYFIYVSLSAFNLRLILFSVNVIAARTSFLISSA